MLLYHFTELKQDIWEPSCGEKHLANVLEQHGYNVRCSDIVQRVPDIEILDFLETTEQWHGDIVMNPPYTLGKEFVRHALDLLQPGGKLVAFLKLQFLEGQLREDLFKEYPPKCVYVSINRITCAKDGDFKGKMGQNGGAVCFCWYIWEKGYEGEPVIRWFNGKEDNVRYNNNKEENKLF